ncbi:uncharacterized protein LOC106153371 [Lingula anatina]|uniref:Uncharacterized protein LOC106153371 n=1 Tax=Lingula anatina TaxID=7574 RepID=A0A1S3H9G2_LINAN|nr:uncharacterized protein LOC106153371 [Lingula anatina]|eukprot:XP_013382735.1 uncharacterized protein LOC106153371 [Lingula anatina]
MDVRVFLILLVCAKLGWSWKMCYVCSGQYPDQSCIRYPQLGSQVNCTRKHCTVSARYMLKPGASYAPNTLGPDDYQTMSISRSCENVDFGNKCVKDWRGPHMTCYTTCFNSFCNHGIRAPGKDMFPGAESTSADTKIEQSKSVVVNPRPDNTITEDQPAAPSSAKSEAGYIGGYPSENGQQVNQHSKRQQHKSRDVSASEDRHGNSAYPKDSPESNRSLPGPRNPQKEMPEKDRKSNSKETAPGGRKALGRGQNDSQTKSGSSKQYGAFSYFAVFVTMMYCLMVLNH